MCRFWCHFINAVYLCQCISAMYLYQYIVAVYDHHAPMLPFFNLFHTLYNQFQSIILHLCLFVGFSWTISTHILILFAQSALRPYLVDPSSRATDWLKEHLKEQRLEVVNQQVLASVSLCLQVLVVVVTTET